MSFKPLVTLVCFLTVLLIGCKKETEEPTGTSNLEGAPSKISQQFDYVVTISQNNIVEIVQKTGATEVAKRTFRYTTDTIYESLFEFGKLNRLRKHRIDASLVTATVDSVYGKDTVVSFKEIFYTYNEAGAMSFMRENNYEITPDSLKRSVLETGYTYKNGNVKLVEYESPLHTDTVTCSDVYSHGTLSAEYDVHNILGVSEGSRSVNLKSEFKRAVSCAGNDNNGSTQIKYWYELDAKQRITKIIYQRTFNGVSEAFQENYTYLSR